MEGLLVAAVIVGLALGLNFGAGRLAVLLLPWIPISVDQRIGQVLRVEVPGFNERCSDPGPERYVRELTKPLLDALGPTPYEFEFRVIPEATPNAFAAPGGLITVHYGLLTTAKSGEEIALVLGHELEHVVLRHATARTLRSTSGFFLFAFLLGGTHLGPWVDAFDDVFARSYDRDEETQADLAGARLAARAGIDPKALGAFFARLPSAGPDALAWLASHPASEDRIRTLESVPFVGPRRELPPPTGLVCSPEPGPNPN